MLRYVWEGPWETGGVGWGGGLLPAKSAHKPVAKLLIYCEIELMLLVYSVLIKTFDLKLDLCPYIFGSFIGFEIKI